jgi:hypothetical protein
MARDAEAEIIDGAELAPAGDGDPFSLGPERPAMLRVLDSPGKELDSPGDERHRDPRAILETLTGQGEGGTGLRADGQKRRKHGRFIATGEELARWAGETGGFLDPAGILSVPDPVPTGGGEHRVLFDEASGPAADGDPFSLGKPRQMGDGSRDASQDPPGTGSAPQGEGSRTGRSAEEIRSEISRATAAGRLTSLREGSEFTVFAVGENAVLKLPLKKGVLTYDRQGRYTRSTDPAAILLKARIIESLGGSRTSVFESGGETAVFQDRGEEITDEEFAGITVPGLEITPQPGFVYEHQIDGRTYLISDLHKGNFAKDKDGNIRLIDLIVGEINPGASLRQDVSDSSLSLGPARLGVLTGDSIRRIKDPLRRAQAMERVSRKLEDLRLEAERLELMAGTKRLKRSLAREASMRQTLRQSELENEAWARHAAILSDDDLTKLRAQPGHAALAIPGDHLHGRLMSKSAALKKHPDLFTVHNPGDYDGSENISRTLFGGTLAPDQAARELFEAGLLKSPDTAALWQLLESEARHVSAMKKVLESAKADLREARVAAKAETNAWLATQTDQQAATYSPRQEILRTLAALDAILSSVPAEIRGHPPFPRPPVRPNGSFRGLPQKANS